MKNIVDRIINLIFPKRCLICNEIIYDGLAFCSDCDSKVKYISDNCCVNCARDKNKCTCGRGGKNSFDGVISVCYYLPPISNLLVSLKLKRDDKKIKLLAGLLKITIEKRYKEKMFDMIVSVPSLKSKEDKEGFNRIDILCENLSKKLDINFSKNALKKTRQTKKQHDLKGNERHSNLLNSYFADSKIVENKRILLIDDIITTASTLSTCAAELKNKGAKNVYCATISATILIINKKT